jgi:hypothetical protein
MNELVDTSVWTLALRRRRSQPSGTTAVITRELEALIRHGRAHLIGPIRQELLSGLSDSSQFTILRDRLRAFPDLPLETADFEEAAAFANQCLVSGIQGSTVDFLICAVASRHDLSIFTTDPDFDHFESVLLLRRHAVPPT